MTSLVLDEKVEFSLVARVRVEKSADPTRSSATIPSRVRKIDKSLASDDTLEAIYPVTQQKIRRIFFSNKKREKKMITRIRYPF